MSIIRSEEALRSVIGEAPAGLQDKNIDHLDHFAMEFIAKSPFLILTTADTSGRCDASPKGDAPGFVHVLDEKTLVIPDRPGNRLAYGHLNILSNGQVGLLFILPGTSETLRVNGTAELDASPELLERLAARGKPAVLGIRVTVEECFFIALKHSFARHCGSKTLGPPNLIACLLATCSQKEDNWIRRPRERSIKVLKRITNLTYDKIANAS